MLHARSSVALKLVLALVLSVVTAVGAVAVFSSLSASHELARYITKGVANRVQALIPALSDHYARNGTLEGAESILTPGYGQVGRNARGYGATAGIPGNLLLADAEGRVLLDSEGTAAGIVVHDDVLAEAAPIVVDGETVGYLLAGIGQQEIEFENRMKRSIVYAGLVGGVVAIALGLLLTQSVVRPLRALKEGAERIGAGDLGHRVAIATRDEIGDVAHQFNDMAARLEAQEQLRRDMMADIAHELRTPLSVIQGQVEALQDGVFDLTAESITPIHTQVVLLGRLVGDLRELALADAGQLDLQKTRLKPHRLVDRVVAGFQGRANERGIRLETSMGPTLHSIVADPQRLEQILSNLLSNALRHTPRGGTITVRLENEDRRLRLSVQDTGSGIPTEDLPHVFERFYRVNRSRPKNAAGTGLGLAIVKKLVEAHDGTIEVESTHHLGTTFTVHLPAAWPPDPLASRS